MEPDVMGLSAGEVVTVEDLLYGLFLDSGNDAAETLARAIIPRSRFLAEMNAKARLLGLADTSFVNPTGLDAPGHYSSAHDLAVVAGYLETRYPRLAAIASAKERRIPATAGHKAFDPRNLNKLVWNYAGADGLKTGFTDAAGGCVAGSATRGGRHLLVLVMGSAVFFTEAERLLDYGFSTSIAG
jgi:D-alanyl-D-alanine carboxypeptidase (penicillin-binding protein 5/6)